MNLYGVVIDRSGRIFFADRLNGRCGLSITWAWSQRWRAMDQASSSGDGGPAAAAGLVEPNGLAIDPDENHLFIADVAGHRVRVIDLATGTIETFAGTGEARHDGDGGRPSRPASSAHELSPSRPRVALRDGAPGKLHPPPP